MHPDFFINIYSNAFSYVYLFLKNKRKQLTYVYTQHSANICVIIYIR